MLSALLLALLPGALAGMYGQPVVHLDAKTFKQALSVEHAAMVAFVAPWCGHCKSLGPEYTSAAKSLSPLIPFYAVDCDDAANKPLCAQYQIKGFPTIKAFPRALKGAARDYNGARTAGELVDYAKGLVPDRVKKLRAPEAGGASGSGEKVVAKWLKEKEDQAHVLLVHPTQASIPFLWKVLGHRLSSRMQIGYARDSTDHAILSAVNSYDPADTARDPVRALYWPKGADIAHRLEYGGEFRFNALLEWLLALLDGKTPPLSASSGGSGARSAANTNANSGAGSDSEAERKARARAKMEEAERRDAARREKLAQRAREGTGTGTGATPADGAPAPQAEEAVVEGEEDVTVKAHAGSSAAPAEPEPEEGVRSEAEEEGAEEARETRAHEEL